MKTQLTLCLSLLMLQPGAWAQTLNQANEGTKPLTDKEVVEAQSYVHQGRKQQVLSEECAKLSDKYKVAAGCQDSSGKPGQVFSGATGTIIEEVLPKLYAIMGTAAMAGSGGTIQMKPKTEGGGTAGGATGAAGGGATGTAGGGATGTTGGGDANTAANGKEGEKRNDICVYIPMAGELVAAGMQKVQENKIQEQSSKPGADAQREGLHAVARAHDARAKTATIQGGVYGATAACYTAYLASGAVMDWKLGLKLGASAVMTGIFFKKAANHKKFAADVRAIASKLPGAGDCNPHTQTQCFCSEPTSRNVDIANYTKVCVPRELASGRDPKQTAIPCSTIVNGNAVLDLECKCKRTNSCLNGQLSSMGAQIGFGGYDLADPLRLLNEMNGQMNEANVENFGTQLSARAKKLLDQNIADVPSMRGLNPKENDLAKEMNKMGMPARMAAFAAQQAGSAPASADSPQLSSIASSGDENSGQSSRQNAAGVKYNSGSYGSSPRRGQQMGAFKSPFDKNANQGAVQVDTYSQEAVAAADINKDTSKGIFDIISHRYRSSAWRRFEMDKVVTDPAPEAEAPKPVQ